MSKLLNYPDSPKLRWIVFAVVGKVFPVFLKKWLSLVIDKRVAKVDCSNRLPCKIVHSAMDGHKQWVKMPGGDHAAFMETPRAYFELVSFFGRYRLHSI